jgi:hypothetical protein
MTYWYSWQHVKDIADRVQTDGIENGRQYEQLREICSLVSDVKKSYLWGQISPGRSPASMEYLFSGWSPKGEYLQESTCGSDYDTVIS